MVTAPGVFSCCQLDTQGMRVRIQHGKLIIYNTMKEQFNLEKYNRLVSEGKTPKIVTREERSVRIVCTDRKGASECIVALVDVLGEDVESVLTFYPNGRFLSSGKFEYDLFFADPTPTYRPYKDAEECFRDAVKHGGWAKDRHTKSYFQVAAIINDRISYMDGIHETFQDMLDENVWADDGQPCGVKEE